MVTRCATYCLACIAILWTGCSNPETPLDPMFKAKNFDPPASTQIASPIVTYRVQGFTSFQGQIYNIPACLIYSWMIWNHNLDPNTVHTDSIMAVQQNGTCGAPSPWNGGWIDVYEVRESGDKIVGQVYGDLVWKDFSYTGPGYLQIKLKAFPDQTRNCQFLYFDGYAPGQSEIVVTGQGDMPLAQFYCN